MFTKDGSIRLVFHRNLRERCDKKGVRMEGDYQLPVFVQKDLCQYVFCEGLLCRAYSSFLDSVDLDDFYQSYDLHNPQKDRVARRFFKGEILLYAREVAGKIIKEYGTSLRRLNPHTRGFEWIQDGEELFRTGVEWEGPQNRFVDAEQLIRHSDYGVTRKLYTNEELQSVVSHFSSLLPNPSGPVTNSPAAQATWDVAAVSTIFKYPIFANLL